ncbi:phage adaptor protein [Mycobacteroides abscessus]|uniref:phage adaptor protein n=1 Tax=Mycobacteroides abscessus TaxID=36809 RepID=UPI0009277E7D|nr:hypothetical protein [Mycobacteroides abscessus]SIC60039.1 Uncharacterised protein [Mycobacteroides abscessus subsp. abscessus]
MAYTLGDIVTEVKAKIKDTSFPDSLIKTYIQDTIDEVLGRNRFTFLEDTLTVNMSATDTEYAFAAPVQTITDITYTTDLTPTQPYRPEYVPYREFLERFPARMTDPAGLPMCFSLYGSTLLIPRALSEDITAKILYVKASPTLANDSDVPVIPVEFKQILVRGAQAGVEEYRENYDQAAIHRRKVEDLASDMLLRYGPRQFIRPGKSSLRGVSNYGQK